MQQGEDCVVNEDVTNILFELFNEFLTCDLLKSGTVRKIVNLGIKDEPYLSFSIEHSKINEVDKYFDQSLTFSKLKTIMTTESNAPINTYGLVQYIFSDIYNEAFNVHPNYNIAPKPAKFPFDNKATLRALKNTVCYQDFCVETNEELLIFEHLEIESSFEIPELFLFNKIAPSQIKKRLHNDWSLVNTSSITTEIKLHQKLHSQEDIAPILSSLLKLYKQADVRFIGDYKEEFHFVKGVIYAKKQGEKYLEHPLTKDAITKYMLSGDIGDFSKFISTNITKMRGMLQSCKMYNMSVSSPKELRVPLYFFVIESFFSDVQSEVSFKIPLYVTKLLNENYDFMENLKFLYGIRSKISHGDLDGATKDIVKRNNQGKISYRTIDGSVNDLNEIVVTLWHRLLEIDWNPKNSSKDIVKYIFNE